MSKDLQAQIAQLSVTQRELLKQKLQKSQIFNDAQNQTLSFSQERIWFLEELEPGNPVYNRVTNLSLTGKLNIQALEQSINEIIHRHEVLRTSFISQDGLPTLVITPQLKISLSLTDLSNFSHTKQQETLQNLALEFAQKPFDLTKIPLLRANLVRLSEEKQILLLTIHHIVFDGWSAEVFLKELRLLYEAFCQSKLSPLSPLSLQYQDFAQSQKRQLQGEKLQLQLNYWKQQLAGELLVLQLPTDYSRPKKRSFSGATYNLTISKSLTDSLKRLSQKEGVTLFMTLLAAFKVLLYRYTSQEDILVGSPIAGRDNLEVEDLIGVFINTLVFRTKLDGNLSFPEFLTQVRQVALEAYANKDVPFEKLVEELQPQRDLSISPIFQVLFQLRSFQVEKLAVKELTFAKFEVDTGIAPFDLTVDLTEISEGLLCKFIYNKQLFNQETIVRMTGHFQTLIEGIIKNLDEKISLLPLLTASEKQQILIDWNDTKVDYPQDKCIHQLFEEQVIKTPDNIAVVFEDQTLTYQQLNEKANQIARQILSLSSPNLEQIALLFEHDAEMIASLLAVLKTGNIYVPLDASYPQQRLNYILEDSQATFLLTNTNNDHLAHQLTQDRIKIVNVDQVLANNNQHDAENLCLNLTAETIAYILYTSGSTGKPKGVVQNHRNVLHFIRNYTNNLHICSTDKISLLASVSFDAAVMDIFGALLNGASLCLYDVKTEDLSLLPQWLESEKITIYHSTPTLYRYLVKEISLSNPNQHNLLPDLRLVVLGGEEVVKTDVEAYRKYLSENCLLVNGYGCTESSFNLQYIINQQTSIPNQKVSLGYAFEETEILLLDEEGNNSEIVGEIAIKSEYVALGYWQQPELTKKVFLRDSEEGKKRIYRTGDWGRLRSDGTIEFLGRKDFQIKMRGIRLELAEIEANLAQHPQIKENVVLCPKNKQEEPYLAAYVIGKAENPEIKELRQFLAQKLPEYMIPNVFVFLDQLPLTPSGKINRKALPQPDFEANRENEFIAPRNQTEIKLAQIWQEVLGIEKLGINDNFFALGGHSLLATQVVSRIRNTFELELPLRYLFESPTIGNLGLRIDQSRKERKSISIPLVSRKQELSPSFAQERLWFITELEGASSVYNMSKVFKIYGNLNFPALEKAIAFVFQRHESLRSNFHNQGGKPYLIINPDVNCGLKIINLENQLEREKELEKTIIKESNRVFDLAKDTLIRFTLIQLSAQEYVLMIVIHHIICDGWSIGILMKELSHSYQAYRENKTPNLPALPIQYVDFGVWQREYLQGNLLQQKIAYWHENLQDLPPLSTFPLDYPRPTTQTFTGGKLKQRINNSLTNQLQNLTQKEGVTLFITLLTALKVLLYRHTQQEKLIIGFPIAGRNNLETEKLIGFFVNTLLISSNLGGNPSFLELLSQVKNSVFKAYEHQDLPFEKLVQEIQPERELSHNPLFQVWFNMVNLESEVLELNEVQVEDLLSTDTTINSKFDLTIYVRELENSLELSWVYNQDLYQEKTINWIAQQYQTLLEEITINPQEKIQNISLLKNYQTEGLFSVKNKIIPDISFKNFVKSEIEQSIIERFEKQVKLFLQKIAIKTKNKQWSYQELNQKANQIANQILSLSTSKTEQIALLFEHDAEMIASLLAVLKTGKIYVPLDASYPEERLNYILEDSQASLLLTNSNNYDLANKLTPEKRVIVNVDEIFSQNADHNSHHFSSELIPETVAYILYTSGSTGKPKGVVQNHRNVLHFIGNYTNNLHISATDNISLLAFISFDAAVMDIFGALLNGATLCLYDVKREDLSLLPQWLESEKITIYHSTPTLYRYLIKEISTFNAHQQNLFPDLRLVVLGGEEVVKKDVEAYKQYFGNNCLFVNGYGPTESTVTMQYFIHQKREIAKNLIPIGYPVEDTEILLLDEEGNNSQILGEIAIKSEYVALGYWRQPELTKKVFLKDSEEGKKRLYRTGDWGRLRSDGTIEFLGRKDFQIKMRGIRLELAEIEANLAKHPQIKENVVICRENKQGDQYLATYLVSNPGQTVNIKQLRKLLAQKLPEYMIPAVFVSLDALPLTPNGKINRKVLPEIDFSTSIEEEFIAPTNETEIKLAQIWQEILGIEKLGINDNFFALGGHSLLATQIVSRIKNILEIELPLRSLFEYSTIAELSEHLTNSYLTNSMITLSPKQDRERGEI